MKDAIRTIDPYSIFKTFAILLLIGMVVQLFGAAYTFQSNYDGRKRQAENSQTACKRAVKDRTGASILGENILDAFKATDRRFNKPLTSSRQMAENNIQDQIDGFKDRAAVDCKAAFPLPKVFE